MQDIFVRAARQPYVALVTIGAALLCLSSEYGWSTGTFGVSTVLSRLESDAGWPAGASATLCLAAILTSGTLLAYHFPIYLRHNTKICIVSMPLYLMGVLLPMPFGATVVGLSVAMGEVLACRSRGTEPVDIVTTTGRWIIIALVGSIVAHIQIQTASWVVMDIPLACAALAMWLGDLLTLPIVLVPITGEMPTRILRMVFKDGAFTEAVQYALGLIGAIAATWQLWALFMLAIPAMLVYLAFKKELDPDTFELLESMADTVDLRDPYTGGHSRRVAELAAGVLDELGMTGQEARLIRTAARIHDLGKMGLPDTVLIKAGALSHEEEVLIQSYPEEGAALLERYPDFSRGIEMVRHHHERWDGMGYPDGLSGTAIPFGARLIAVVDAYDAMTSDRPYRRALTPERAAAILQDGKGRQWDPTITDAFLRSLDQETETTTSVAAPDAPARVHGRVTA